MKKIFLSILAAFLMTACGSEIIEVEIHNPSAAARKHETVEIPWSDISSRLKDITPNEIVVLNDKQEQVPSQVVYEGEDTPQMLIFQVSLPGAETANYQIREGEREEYPVQAYGRFVPEQSDDYAWENNLAAYRVYGPAPEEPLTPGIDVWVKSTQRMVIDDWFSGKDYHTNKGEGMDAYEVGQTLGGGASAPYFDGRLWLSSNFEKQQRLDNGPIRTSVKLTYAPFIVGDTFVALEKIISLDANSYFSQITDIYTGGFETMPIAAGIALHDVKEHAAGEDYIAVYEAVSDSMQPEIDGNIALGVIMPEADESIETDGHLSLVKKVINGQPLVYWSGSGWSQAGIEDLGQWLMLSMQKQDQIREPLTVILR